MKDNYVELSRGNLRAANQNVRIAIEDTNRVDSFLKSTLFGLVAFGFTFSSPLFVNLEKIGSSSRIILLVSWGSALISLFAGICAIVQTRNFYKAGAFTLKKISTIWKEPTETQVLYDEKMLKTDKLFPADQILEAKESWLKVQIIMLLTSLLSLFVISAFELFGIV